MRESKKNKNTSNWLRSWPHLLAFFALLSLLFVTALFWLEVQRRFPLLPSGDYYGTVSGVIHSEEDGPLRVFVRSDSSEIRFVVLRSDWSPYRVSTVPKSKEDPWLYPVKIPGPKKKSLYLVGAKVSEGFFSGFAADLGSGEEGTWKLQRMGAKENRGGDYKQEDAELLHWLELFDELLDVETSFAVSSAHLPQLRREVSQTEEFITEGKMIREKGADQFENAQANVQSAQSRLRDLKSEAQVLLGKLKVAQRVTQMGTLVSLAREADERDSRWIASMLRTGGAGGLTRELQAEYERAQKVLELQDSIRKERKLIRELSQRIPISRRVPILGGLNPPAREQLDRQIVEEGA